MAVTKEQVFAAADQISVAGQRPTLEAVRKITGGSYTTISPALNEWKARQATTAAPLREPAPQAVADRLAEVGAELWAIALELANARLSSEREALEKARSDMEAAQAEATELADRLTTEVEEQQVRLASIEAAEQVARTEAGELRAQLTAAREQAHTAEARVLEIERRAGELRQELDRAHQEADQVRAELAEQQKVIEAAKQAARAEADALRGQLTAAQEQAHTAEARVLEIERRAGEMCTALERAHQDADQVRSELATVKAKAEADRNDRERAREQVATAREDAAQLRGQVEALQAQQVSLLRALEARKA